MIDKMNDLKSIIKTNKLSFEEYLLELMKMMKSEPENIIQTSNIDFAKAIDEAFRESIDVMQESLLKEAFPTAKDPTEVFEMLPQDKEERRKALDSYSMTAEQRKALDSYSNNALMIGQADAFSSFDSYDFNSMMYAWPLWTSLYTSSWVFAKVIDRTGSDMIRNGWKTSVQPERRYQLIKKGNKIYRKDITPEYDISKVYDRQNAMLSHLTNATKWMLLYGGSVICLLDDTVEDIAEYATPLVRLPKGAKLNFITADRWQGVISGSEMVTDDSSPDFGEPEFYSVRAADGTFYRFHHSRVARFVNGELPTFLKTMLRGWGLPVGTRLYNEINRDERIKNMITSLLSKYNLEIVSTDGMKAYMHGELTPEMEAQLDNKLSLINRYRHFNSTMFLDKNDTYQRLDGNVGGLYQLFDSNTRAVTGAASMPMVLLYGDQTAGLSGSSHDDLKLWEEHLESERGAKLRKPIEKINKWLLMAEGIYENNVRVSFNSSLPKTINEKIDESRAVLDLYSQLESMGLYDTEMIAQELKERDDLLFGNQLKLKSKEELAEIEEEADEYMDNDSGFEYDEDDFNEEDLGGDDLGGEDDFEDTDLSPTDLE